MGMAKSKVVLDTDRIDDAVLASGSDGTAGFAPGRASTGRLRTGSTKRA